MSGPGFPLVVPHVRELPAAIPHADAHLLVFGSMGMVDVIHGGSWKSTGAHAFLEGVQQQAPTVVFVVVLWKPKGVWHFAQIDVY